MWWFGGKGPSGFSGSSTAEEVTHGIDGSGLTAIVTGATSGIGAQTARVLALRGVHVVMGIRNMEAGREIKSKLVQEIPEAKFNVMELDLSSMQSVRKFASDYKASNYPLNLLINNAGIMGVPFTLSKDNIELHFATNHLGHFLLTHLLLDTMKQTASKSGREGRIINVSSEGHRFTYSEGIRFDKLNDPSGYNIFRTYGQSKLANILHARQLAKNFKHVTSEAILGQEDGSKITANSLHPGCIPTNIVRHNSWMNNLRHNSFAGSLLRIFAKYVLKDIPQGAATTCYLALHPQVNGVSGEYFSNCNLAKPSSKAQDDALGQKLWDFSLDLVK